MSAQDPVRKHTSSCPALTLAYERVSLQPHPLSFPPVGLYVLSCILCCSPDRSILPLRSSSHGRSTFLSLRTARSADGRASTVLAAMHWGGALIGQTQYASERKGSAANPPLSLTSFCFPFCPSALLSSAVPRLRRWFQLRFHPLSQCRSIALDVARANARQRQSHRSLHALVSHSSQHLSSGPFPAHLHRLASQRLRTTFEAAIASPA